MKLVQTQKSSCVSLKPREGPNKYPTPSCIILFRKLSPFHISVCCHRSEMKGLFVIIFTSLYYFSVLNLSTAGSTDTLAASQSIVSSATLVSSSQSFELGLFSTGNSRAWYLGIWYKNYPDIVVWVANRENPLADSYGAMMLSKNGTLILLDQMNSTIWSSSPSREAEDPVAQLLETGNLVVIDKALTSSESYFWQSFDQPSDTLLPGMRLRLNFKTGPSQFLTSWKNASDPSVGLYTYKIDLLVLPQFVLTRGSKKKFRSGPWNGLRFTGLPVSGNEILKPSYVYNTNELYYIYQANNNSITTRLKLTETGELQRQVVNKGSSEWAVMYTLQNDRCDDYGECGPNGICKINRTPICECLQGFVPKSQQEWEVLNRTSGCKRQTPLDCQKGEGFLRFQNTKLPDLLDFSVNNSISVKECEAVCLKNCSCVAYAKSNMSSGGIGCLMWFGELIDMREFIDEVSDQDLYIRMPASELGNTSQKKKTVLISVISAASALLFLGVSCWCIVLKKRAKTKGSPRSSKEDIELPLFDLHTIEIGTNYFSWQNKLGEGGFGPVYKATLRQEELVAVKRLSRDSGQGLKEFTNEVTMIANLQHRNLVKLLGCCIEGEERMLIYEYMPNKSLDFFIFDQDRKNLLNWQKRFDIIMGIARGLLYLHQDSRLRIIHRDLKNSNILLDHELTPKISDFGIARIFDHNQTEGKTKRVIGTYGYMSPEYTIDGKFSVKSDVFSFGVLLLEIISGRKNKGFIHPDHHHSLLGHAWLLWNKNKALELIDPCLENTYVEHEVLRCIQVGLLCVQKLPNDRPAMSSAVFMLCNEEVTLPEPKEPGFFIERSSIDNETLTGGGRIHTGLEITISTLEAR